MIDLSTWKKAWALLDSIERLKASIILVVVILAALSSAVMVASVMPFLAVLAEPSRVETTPALAWAYHAFGFTSEYDFLVGLGLFSFALIVFSSLIQVLKTWALTRFAMMRTHSISQSLLKSYLAQPYVFFLNRHSGDMAPRILQESTSAVNRFLRPAAEFIAACLTASAIVCLLLWLDPIVAVIALAVLGGIYGVIYSTTRRRLRLLGQIQVEANQARFRIANESLVGIKEIKLLGCEVEYIDRYEGPSIRIARAVSNAAVMSQVPHHALQALSLGGVILLCLVLIRSSGLTSERDIGGLLPIIGVFAFAGQRIMPELSKIYQSLADMQVGSAAVNAVYEDLILNKSAAVLSREPVAGLGLTQSIFLDAVSYSYPNSVQMGVRDVTMEIRAGEKIGIVGSTGAGKTTLADVILGLLEPTHGRVVVDGQNVTPKNLRAWMKSVSYVPQEIFLTDASISENIALGTPPEYIDFERIRSAARIAQIDQFIIDELPERYQTHLGERGVRLSGGQRQRIGIARALYHDSDLIVFDEATSALDNLTEAEVMGAIDALPGDKTVVLIAHRLSTVKRCDRIIVLDKGRVVGCDSWANLMKGNEYFRRIAHLEKVP